GKVKRGKLNSWSSRVGLQFPVGKIHRLLKELAGAVAPPETLPFIAGKPVSSHVICNNWLFAITRNSTNFFQA
ncbi:unnamed protein product, partial [Timema podura]|nr:unnamed protein product [Timema podura]